MKKIKIIFIGAGNIVTGYERNLKNCHLASLKESEDYEIVGVVDPNDENVEVFQKATGKERYELNELKNLEIDIIAICTPTETHDKLIDKIISLGIRPRCIFCEKPFTNSLNKANLTFNNLTKNGIGLIIGYQRSFMNSFKEIAIDFQKSYLGSFLFGDFKYSKGLLNNGSHAIDLIYSIFGDVNFERFGKSFVDYNVEDPSLEVFFSFQKRSIHLIPIDERIFSIFEADLIFEKARFRFIDNSFKLERYKLGEDSNFPGYVSLNPDNYKDTEMHISIDNMWREIAEMYHNENFFSIKRSTFVHEVLNDFKLNS